MENIKHMINSIDEHQIKAVLLALLTVISFKIISSIIAHIIIKIFKISNKQDIKNNTFYRPLKACFTLLGVYLAILILKLPFKIEEQVLLIINKIFRILIILIVANGLAQNLNTKSKLIMKIQNKLNPNKEINTNSLGFLVKIVKVFIYTVAIILIIQEFGYDLKALITGLGIGGVILTLAAQDTAKNLFAGLVIFLDRPFKVGDYVQFKEYSGTIEDITFRSTAIRSLDDAVLHIPNAEISTAVITNWTELKKRRYKTNLVILLETPLTKIEEVKQKIINMLLDETQILKDTIMVNFQNILDNGIELVVIAYFDIINYTQYINIKEKINYQIMNILEESSVQLAYTTQTIHIKN